MIAGSLSPEINSEGLFKLDSPNTTSARTHTHAPSDRSLEGKSVETCGVDRVGNRSLGQKDKLVSLELKSPTDRKEDPTFSPFRDFYS